MITSPARIGVPLRRHRPCEPQRRVQWMAEACLADAFGHHVTVDGELHLAGPQVDIGRAHRSVAEHECTELALSAIVSTMVIFHPLIRDATTSIAGTT